jgi:cobyrinic acid a,c-diamide synthase
MPILAECGGLMYLSRSIKDWEGKSWPGVGLVPGEVIMTRRLQELGYVQATALKDTVIAGSGEELRGHEFHYSTLEGINPQDCAFECEGGMRPGLRRGGYAQGSLLASYLHLQLRANPTAAQRFIARCLEYRNR